MPWISRFVPLLLVGAAAMGCQQQQKGSVVASASGESGYAMSYPDMLTETGERFVEHESEARSLLPKFANYTSELHKTDWATVRSVYEAADAAGGSGAYVAQARENQAVERFFKEEKGEISKKVAGAAQYAAKQKGCTAEVYGPASHALDKAVEKQLEERLRAHSEAHQVIEDNQDVLGKPNLEKLRAQADELSRASYLVRVATRETREEIEQRIAEGSDVKKTLDRTIERAREVEGNAARGDADKKAAALRRERAEKAKERIDATLEQAQKGLEALDKRIEELRREYDKALEELLRAADEKAKAEPPAGGAHGPRSVLVARAH